MFGTLDKLHSHSKWIYINKEADTAEAEGVGSESQRDGSNNRSAMVVEGGVGREEPPQWIKRASRGAGRVRGKDVNW